MKSMFLLFCLDFTIRAVLGESETLYNRYRREQNGYGQEKAERTASLDDTPKVRKYYECYEVVETIDVNNKGRSGKIREAKKIFSSMSPPPPHWANIFKPPIKRMDPRLIAHRPRILYFNNNQNQGGTLSGSGRTVPESRKLVPDSRETQQESRRRHPGSRWRSRWSTESISELPKESGSFYPESTQAIPEARPMSPEPITTPEPRFIPPGSETSFPEESGQIHPESTQATPGPMLKVVKEFATHGPMLKVVKEFATHVISYFVEPTTAAPVRLFGNETAHNHESVSSFVQEFDPFHEEPNAQPIQNPVAVAPVQNSLVAEAVNEAFQQEQTVAPNESESADASRAPIVQATTLPLSVLGGTRLKGQDPKGPQGISETGSALIQDFATETPTPGPTPTVVQEPTRPRPHAITYDGNSLIQGLDTDNQASNKFFSTNGRVQPLDQKPSEGNGAQEKQALGQALEMTAEQVTLSPAQGPSHLVVQEQTEVSGISQALVPDNRANFYEFTTSNIPVEGQNEGVAPRVEPANGHGLVQDLDANYLTTSAVVHDNHANFYEFTTPNIPVQGQNEGGAPRVDPGNGQGLVQGLDTNYLATPGAVLEPEAVSIGSWSQQSQSEARQQGWIQESTFQLTTSKIQESSMEGIVSSAEDKAAEVFDTNDDDDGIKDKRRNLEIIFESKASGEVSENEKSAVSTNRIGSFIQESVATNSIPESEQETSVLSISAPLHGRKFNTFKEEGDKVDSAREKDEKLKHILPEPVVQNAQLPQVSGREAQEGIGDIINPSNAVALVSNTNAGEGNISMPDSRSGPPTVGAPELVVRSFSIRRRGQLPQKSGQEAQEEDSGSANVNINSPYNTLPLESDSYGGGNSLNLPDSTPEPSAADTPPFEPRLVGINSARRTFLQPNTLHPSPNANAPHARLIPALQKELSSKIKPLNPAKNLAFQLSAEHCGNIKKLAETYHIADVVDWIAKNCDIARLYFPSATCEEMKHYVASCYQMKFL